jgi:hypothetical protein
MQAIPSVLSAATRLAYLDISENDFLISADDLHWLSVNLRCNSHRKPHGLKVQRRTMRHMARGDCSNLDVQVQPHC